ncbi:MAG: YolD-like family protein [Bacilli bacterium]
MQSNLERAKQFMPFDALKGYREALKEKETVIVPKIELSEDEQKELNYLIYTFKTNDMLEVIHYQNNQYVKTIGILSKIDIERKEIVIVKTKIKAENIFKIELYNV